MAQLKPTTDTATAPAVPRRWLRDEVWLVFALSLGAAGLRAFLDLVRDLLAHVPLSSQTTTIVTSKAEQPWLDLVFQLVSIGLGLVPVLLAVHFLHRSGENLSSIGLDRREPGRDLLRGGAIAAVIGGAGLGLYLTAHALGFNVTVVAESLPHVWWRIPVLVLAAFQNGLIEEALVLGYLIHRLGQLGWSPARAVALSAFIRGSYHLYQGFGGFAGNLVMGLIFGYLYLRWRRAAALFVAHTLIDTVAFVGYALLAGHVSWLPTG
jgi:membrane protease YdiL (CAAX protease family)